MNTRKITYMITCALAVCALTGCPSDGKPTPAGTSKTSATGSAASSGELTPEQLDKEDIPTTEDFEEEAAKDITDETYLDELAKLEEEIGEDDEDDEKKD